MFQMDQKIQFRASKTVSSVPVYGVPSTIHHIQEIDISFCSQTFRKVSKPEISMLSLRSVFFNLQQTQLSQTHLPW